MALTYSGAVVTQEGKLKVFGNNQYGQLGNGNTNKLYSPVQVDVETAAIGVKQVALGFFHTVILMNDGRAKATGFNARGQLGLGHAVDQVNFKDVPLTGVKQVACGEYHTMFLMKDGTVKAAGANNYGQLGIGNTNNQNSAQQVDISGVKEVYCGLSFTLFLMQDGTVKACGLNNMGQLGLGSTNTEMRPVALSLQGVKQIACGEGFTMFLMNDGTVKAVGANGYGQLGIGEMNSSKQFMQNVLISGVKQLSCGQSHTTFLMEDGTVKGVGVNIRGELGIQDTTSRSTPVLIPVNDVVKVANGAYSSYFILKDGSVSGCGYNSDGSLGIGSGQNPIPFIVKTGITSGAVTMQEYIKMVLVKFLFQQVDQLKTWLAGGWKNLTGPVTKDLFLAEGVSSLSGIPVSSLTNGTKILKWSDENGSSKLIATSPKSIYDASTKLYKGTGVIETVTETLIVKANTLIVNADHTEATFQFSLDNGLSWYNIISGEVKDISGITGLQLKVRANLPNATSTLTALSYAWA